MVSPCFFLKKILFIYFQREGREKDKERNINAREKLIGCFSPMPRLGTKPTTQACALTRNQIGDLLLCGTMPNQLSHTSRGKLYYFKCPAFNQPGKQESMAHTQEKKSSQ